MAHVTSPYVLRNVAFPQAAQALLWQIQWLPVAFPAVEGNVFSLLWYHHGAELQVHDQVRALGLKWSTLPVVLWCNNFFCMVLFIVLTMCCRNRAQSRLSICAFPLVSDKGRSVQSLHGSPGSQLTSGELEGSFSQEKWFCCEAEPC